MPTGLITSILAVTSCLVLRQCDGLRCLECNNVFWPLQCTNVTECSDSSNCFIQKRYYALNRFQMYSMGCMSPKKCQEMNISISKSLSTDDVLWTPPDDTVRRSVDARYKRSDMSVWCNECCDGNEFCNIEGCGASVDTPPARGPLCYDCDKASYKTGCRHIQYCGLGDVCSVQHSSFPGFYTARCVPQSECMPSLVGRRAASPKIPFCCNLDFCNTLHNNTAAAAHTE